MSVRRGLNTDRANISKIGSRSMNTLCARNESIVVQIPALIMDLVTISLKFEHVLIDT